MNSLYDFTKFVGSISEIHLACHSIVLELDNGIKLLIECDASHFGENGNLSSLRSEVGHLCGKQIIRSTETDTRDLIVELQGGSWIKVEVSGFDGDGGDWPITLFMP